MGYYYYRMSASQRVAVMGGILPFVDDFDRSNGGLGDPWESGGATWAIAGNEAVNTPTEGAERLTNGDMETGDPPTGWNASALAVLAADADAHSGLQSLSVTASGGTAYAFKDSTHTSEGTWFILRGWRKGDSSRFYLQSTGGYIPPTEAYSVEAAYTQLIQTGRVGSALYIRAICYVENDTEVALFDDVSVKYVTLNTLFTDVDDGGTADIVAQVELDTVVAGTQAGLVLNLDDKDTPANFIIAYHDGTNAKLEKCVAGTYTSVISAAAAYAAGATLVVVKDGTSYSLYYNNAKIGSTSTISDAGIISNTKHGLFSTYSGNQLDDFSVEAN